MVKKKTSRYDAEAKKALRDSGVKTIQIRVPDLSRFHPDGYGGGAIIAVEVILPQTSATFVSGDDREPGRIGASIGSVLRQFYVYNPAQKRIEFVEDFKKLWKRYTECYERGKSLPDVLNTKLTQDIPCQMYRKYMDWNKIGGRPFLPVEYANEEIAEFVRFCEQPPTVAAPKQEAPTVTTAAPKQEAPTVTTAAPKQEAPTAAPAAAPAPAAPKQADPAPAPAAPKQADPAPAPAAPKQADPAPAPAAPKQADPAPAPAAPKQADPAPAPAAPKQADPAPAPAAPKQADPAPAPAAPKQADPAPAPAAPKQADPAPAPAAPKQAEG